MTLGATLYAQLPSFEWRLENEQLTASNTYEIDVNLYNTGTTTFELRAGTIAFFVNPSWVNGGSLTVSTPSSGLVTGQQSGAASYVGTGSAYFRKVIASLQPGTFVTGGSSKMFHNKISEFSKLFNHSYTKFRMEIQWFTSSRI